MLFFAFIIGIVWYYINDTFKDNVSKEAVIPGLKAILLIFAATLVLVDAFMFFETDRLVQAASGANGSCISYTGADLSSPSSAATTIGTYLSGTISAFSYQNDGDLYTVIQTAGTPGSEVTLNYTDIGTFIGLYFQGQAEGSYNLDLQVASTGAWNTIYAFSNTTGMISNHFALNGTQYINGTNVTARIRQTDAGNVSHRLVMDWLVIDKETTYTAYCSDTLDTQYIFIYHNMETEMMMLLLSMLPYAALMAGTLVTIQVVLLLKWFSDGKNNPKR